MSAFLWLSYFGPFEVRQQTAATAELLAKPPTLKSQSLLAYLAFHRQRAHPRDRLADMFWGDRPADKTRRSLSTALWHIRRCFGEVNPILADNQSVQFHFPGEIWSDIEAFEEQIAQANAAGWQEAAKLYRGDFLDGFYDDWALNERYRLHALYLEALIHLMRHYEAAAQPQAALQTALAVLTEDNLREEAHRLAMRAYVQLGQRQAALKQYRLCREVVVAELNSEPMADTTALYQAIYSGTYTFEPPISAVALTPQTPASPALTPVGINTESQVRSPFDATLRMPFVGRSAEVTLLQERWRQASKGQGGLVLISGETGVGKTRLLEALGEWGQAQGALILNGRCYEFERLLPYQPIVEALRPLLVALSSETVAVQPPSWVMLELARLAPDLFPRAPQPQELDPSTEQDQTHLFYAIDQVLALFAVRQPLLILLEDLHWVTEPALELLHFLVRRLQQRPLLFVGTYRQETVDRRHPLRTIERQLEKSGLARSLRLSRLSPEASDELVVTLSGRGEAALPLARRLYRETEGNPFFLVEMIKALFENNVIQLEGDFWQDPFTQLSAEELPLPTSISQAIQERVQRLGLKTQEALDLAAVLGREFDLDLLIAVWNQGEEATLAALDDLLRARLIEEGADALGRDYAFTHHKIQEVVYEHIPRRRRQYGHAQAALAMESLYEDQIEHWLGQLAFHSEQGRKIDKSLTGKAITYLRRAGEQAMAQFAASEAVGYIDRALTLTKPADTNERYALLLAREAAHDWQGKREAQARDLVALADLVASLPEKERSSSRMIELSLRQFNYTEVTGDYVTATNLAQKIIRLARAAGDVEREAIGYLKWGQILYRQGEYQAARPRLLKALSLAQIAGLRSSEASTRQAIALVSWAQGDYDQATAYVRQALRLFEDLGNRRYAGITLMTLGNIYQYRSDLDKARTYFTQSLELFQEIGDRRSEGMTLGNLGVVAEDQSDYAAAQSFYEQGLVISREIGDRRQEALTQHNLGTVALELGNYAWAESCFEQCLVLSQEIGYRRGQGGALRGLARVALEQGYLAKAEEHLAQALTIYRELGERRGEAVTLIHLSQWLARSGDFEAAIPHGQQALALLQEIGSRIGEGLAFMNLGFIDCMQELHAEAYERGQLAQQIAQKLGNHSKQGKSLLLLGQALAGLNRPAEADEAYRQALEAWESTGQTHLAADALAGRAAVALAQGDLTAALEHVNSLWPRLDSDTLHGVESPGQIYLTCYQVLVANQDERAPALLRRGYQLLQTQAAELDASRQRLFWQNVPAHRELAMLYQEF